MLGSLVDVQTEDGIKLHGFLTRTQSQSSWVWIIVHGVNGNFYGSTLLSDLALCVQRLGHDALLVNTRGHDLATFGSADYPARMGSMFETISDGQTDLFAWIRLCKQLGYANIGCIAHSLGAVKVSYALAHRGLDHQRLDLQRFVALSPPRLNTELLSMDPAKREIFDQQLQEAQQWCDKGFPHHIMRVRFPLANWVSAETFMDKYGSGLKYDYFAWWTSIGVPTLWVFGQQEVRQGSVNFRDVDQQLEQVFRNQEALDHRLAVIPQADHSYRGQRDPLAESIQGWVQSF
jgi:pimeloyl-ACP methyl ester carboxylesterase